MLKRFRNCYPQGSLVGELIDIDRGLYIVKVSVHVEGNILATGLAAADKVEIAEDRARERAIAALTLETDRFREKSVISNQEDSLSTSSPQVQSVPTTNKDSAKNNSAEHNYSNVVNLSVPQAVNSSEISKASESPVLPIVEPETIVESTAPPVSHSANNQTVPNSIKDTPGNLFEGTFDHQEVETEDISVMPPTDSIDADTTVKIDFYAIKHETDLELQRLGWTTNEGKDFLKRTYGKLSRLKLTDEQLLEFLNHLKSLPTPE